MLLKLENEERGTGNGKRKTKNIERGTGNGDRGTRDGSLGTSVQHSKWRTKGKKRLEEYRDWLEEKQSG